MSEKKSKEREEINEALRELKEIQKGKVSKEVLDAVIDKMNEDEIEHDKAAQSKNQTPEIQPNI